MEWISIFYILQSVLTWVIGCKIAFAKAGTLGPKYWCILIPSHDLKSLPILFFIPWNLMCRTCHANVPTICICDWSKPMVSLLAIESCHIMVNVISNKPQKRSTLSADYLFRNIMFHNILFLMQDLIKMSLIIKLPYTIQALKEWDALLNVLIAEMIKWNFISERLMLLNNW